MQPWRVSAVPYMAKRVVSSECILRLSSRERSSLTFIGSGLRGKASCQAASEL